MNITEQAILMENNERTLKGGDDQSLSVKFKLMSAETENLNKRIYPKAVLAKAVEGLKARIAKRRDSFAASGHKDSPEVDDAAAFLEDIEMQGDDVIATARVIATQKGKNIITLLKNGAALGVSARGRGEMDGNKVKPGFVLDGFDWVLSPGFNTFVGKSNIIESVVIEEDDNPALAKAKGYPSLEALNEAMAAGVTIEQDPEKVLRLKYHTAQYTGYQGDFAEFKKTFNRTATESLIEQKFEQAREAGYKGSLEEYRAALSIKK